MPITTPYNDETTAMQVVEGLDLSGRRIIVTGGGSGIGVETARALASAGADVTIAVRTPAEIGLPSAHLDLSDPASVDAFVASWEGSLHALVNNAGVMACPETRTPQGWELQFATNHLGHFALATGLYEALRAAEGARVVSVSSSGHLRSPVVFDDIHFERRPYEPWEAYGQAKTANVLFAVEATRRWADDGIFVNALMPGAIRTPLQRHLDEEELEEMRQRIDSTSDLNWKTPEQGAATSVLCAVSPLLEGVGGRYFEDGNEAGPNQPGTRRGYAPYPLDPDAAARLWDVSLQTLAGAGRQAASAT
ncbi:MAG TPA: SDR family NAD(P)-dependent oxidoreductase [Solirubrobacteraceae bacterium]|jgi:NAD(P)-dependent dehydrogenase (short-subunit alcohol dehydrogenase family)|nr:SDR family NAD(P)-dependent oxidoreductase [Solirubrobacteraceae bacterium]